MHAQLPLSEDYLYWDPETICHYPMEPGPEDKWFIPDAGSCGVKAFDLSEEESLL